MPDDARQKRASITTLGCRLNQADAGLIEERLRAAGYMIVPFGEPADVGIINTCTVTGEADAKSRKQIRAFIRKNPRAFVAVVGCYPEVESEAIAGIKGVDLVVGNEQKLEVLDYVSDKKNSAPVVIRDSIQRANFTIRATGQGSVERRVNLKIQEGCDFACTYCIVPRARGPARSRDMGNLLEEAARLVERGVKEIVLTGVNIGAYSFNDYTLVDVIQQICKIQGLARIRVSSTEPAAVHEDLFPLMNDPSHALLPHLHLPVQSGSNQILKSMRRRYIRKDFLDFVERAHAEVADICIGTDLMVGFPGENDADFDASCRLLEDGHIDYAHVFKYSERPGTPAASFPNKVDAKVKNARSARIRRLGAKNRRRFYRAHLGRILDVLFEEEAEGRWLGYTPNYIRVGVRSEEALDNIIRPVRLMELAGDIVIGEIAG